MRIDLHTHSNRSDGTTPPAELVADARAQGIDVLGLTDHDTTGGWAEAARAAADLGVTLVRGLEISCTHRGRGAHLLAYLPDPDHPGLVAELDRVIAGRDARLPATLDRLRSVGIDLDESDVRRLAGDPAAIGRPHVADALVERGVVRDRAEAFATYLGPGGPGYVHRYAAPLEPMLDLVSDAGGVAVLAHPWAERYSHDALGPDALAALRDRGLAGIEVDHQDHTPASRAALRALARDLDLVATGSSDYHGAGKTDHELGCHTTAPEELERLLERAAAAAAAAATGRTPPPVLHP